MMPLKNTSNSNDKLYKKIKKIVAMLDSGRVLAASEQLNKLQNKFSDDYRVYYFQGVAYEIKKNYPDALKKYICASKLNPTSSDCAAALAKMYCKQSMFEQARNVVVAYLDSNPDAVDVLWVAFEVFYKLENEGAQVATLLRLVQKTELNRHQLDYLFYLFKRVGIARYTPTIVSGLQALLNTSDINPRVLGTQIQRYVLAKYFEGGPPSISLVLVEQLAADELLMSSLCDLLLCHPEVESFLLSLRRFLLEYMIENQRFSSEMVRLASVLALNNYLNEYVGYISDREKVFLNGVTEALIYEADSDDWTPRKSEGLLLLLCMYQGLYGFSLKVKLATFPAAAWPESLKAVVKKSLFDIEREYEESKSIKCITSIENSISVAVRQQYEENPYPRWNRLCVSALKNIGEFLQYVCPSVVNGLAKEFFERDTPILIAGSGTGMQPIAVAMRFPFSDVTAVDISRRSLGYASLKSKEMNVDNVHFLQGDILELSNALSKFYYIECCGVLHHMEDPEEGWRKLVELLEPGGVMNVALYSARARKDIAQERDKLAKLGLEPTVDNIRLYRKALFSQSKRSPLVTMFSDFYSLSECRDLLFHQQETCYTWLDIKAMCNTLGLKFLGLADFSKSDHIFRNVLKDEEIVSLQVLDELEQAHPHLFNGMYQFLVQKI